MSVGSEQLMRQQANNNRKFQKQKQQEHCLYKDLDNGKLPENQKKK